jgi:hypothetical protein
MCWSGEASTVLAIIGIGSALYAAIKKEPAVLVFTLGYFSSMEALQAYTYTVINECSNPKNQIATILGYLHIAFQPFFINALSLFFIPDKVRVKIAPAVYAACFVSVIIMIIQLYPFDWAGLCHDGPLCASQLCSVSGNWHIAWDIPINGIANSLFADNLFVGHGYPAYTIVGMWLPLLYGSWRVTLYHSLFGPFLASLLTDNINEWPAVWCLLSIGILLIVVKTRLRNILYVKKWFWWPKKLL